MDDFRRFFLRGLGALVPTLLTIAILIWAYKLVNDYVGVHMTRGLLLLCSAIRAQPAPGVVDEETDTLVYGTPINEWNAFGERLTIEYKVVHHTALRHPNPKARAHAEKLRNEASGIEPVGKGKRKFAKLMRKVGGLEERVK